MSCSFIFKLETEFEMFDYLKAFGGSNFILVKAASRISEKEESLVQTSVSRSRSLIYTTLYPLLSFMSKKETVEGKLRQNKEWTLR